MSNETLLWKVVKMLKRNLSKIFESDSVPQFRFIVSWTHNNCYSIPITKLQLFYYRLNLEFLDNKFTLRNYSLFLSPFPFICSVFASLPTCNENIFTALVIVNYLLRGESTLCLPILLYSFCNILQRAHSLMHF